jgi:hypothetical protein
MNKQSKLGPLGRFWFMKTVLSLLSIGIFLIAYRIDRKSFWIEAVILVLVLLIINIILKGVWKKGYFN